MMLGDLLDGAHRAARDFVTRAGALDSETIARLEAIARVRAETPTTLVRRAVAEFERAAPEEEWATLISTLRRSADPGTACLAGMIRWYVARLEPGPSPIPTGAASAASVDAPHSRGFPDRPAGASHER